MIEQLNISDFIAPSYLDIDRVLGEVVRKISLYLNIETCALLLLENKEEDTEELEIISIYSKSGDEAGKGLRFRLDNFSPTVKAIKGKRYVFLEEMDEEDRSNFLPDVPNGSDLKSALILPLIWQNKVYGTIELYESRSHLNLNELNLKLLQDICREVPKTIENSESLRGTQKRLDELTLLYQITNVLNSTLDLSELLSLIMDSIIKVTKAERSLLMLYDKKSENLELKASHNIDEIDILNKNFKISYSVIKEVAKEGEPILTDNAMRDPRFENINSVIRYGLHSILCVPLKVRDRIIGVIYVDSRIKDRIFSEDSLNLLSAFAAQAAVAIENARLYTEAKRADELAVLRRIAQTISSSIELEETLNNILGSLRTVIPYQIGKGCIWDGERRVMITKNSSESGYDLSYDLQCEWGEECTSWIAFHRAPLFVPNIDAMPDLFLPYKEELPIKAYLGVPLTMGDRFIGTLEFISDRDGIFTEDHLHFLNLIASEVAVAIENAQLFNSVKEQMKELERTHTQLRQSAKLADIGSLVTSIAHEINNPLTSILGFTSFLLQNIDEADPRFYDLKVIEEEAFRARDIVRGLLDFARENPPKRGEADINEIIKDVISLTMIQHSAELSNVTIIEDYTEDLPSIWVDINQFKQVFINIINNAIQAMLEGGTLTISTRVVKKRREGLQEEALAAIGDKSLDKMIYSDEEVPWIEISFTDTGYGIPDNILPDIFTPFFTTKEEIKGVGLGLSVSYGIIKSHGGTIEVQSEVGKGSTFIISLPVQPQSSKRGERFG